LIDDKLMPAQIESLPAPVRQFSARCWPHPGRWLPGRCRL